MNNFKCKHSSGGLNQIIYDALVMRSSRMIAMGGTS